MAEEKEKAGVVFSGTAFIDEGYMPLVQDRLSFYQKISKVFAVDDLFEIKEEFLDRFGVFGKNIENLFLITEIQCLLYPHPVSKCKISTSDVVFIFEDGRGKIPTESFLTALREAAKNIGTPFKVSPNGAQSLRVSFRVKSLVVARDVALNFSKNFSVIVSRLSL